MTTKDLLQLVLNLRDVRGRRMRLLLQRRSLSPVLPWDRLELIANGIVHSLPVPSHLDGVELNLWI